MEIYSAPDYLIVHLKRFSHSRGMWGGRKVGDLITFPVEGLDLTKYILKNSTTNVKSIYDLYAVSNHFGGLDGGHYTAYAKNWRENKWFNYDDSSCSSANSKQLVTSAAYNLFYRRRAAINLEEVNFDEIKQTATMADLDQFKNAATSKQPK